MNFILGIMIILRLRKLGLTEISLQDTSGIIFPLNQINFFVWKNIEVYYE
jgi:hypothetical protein